MISLCASCVDQTTYKTNKFEQERLDRIADNNRRMEELGLKEAVKDIQKSVDQNKKQKPTKKPVKRSRGRRVAVNTESRRRSNRVQNKPPGYYTEPGVNEPKSRSASSSGGGRARGRCAGLKALVDFRDDPVAAWNAAPRGWKPELGCPSDQAGDRAYKEAQKFVKQLEAKGRRAYVKELSSSQVASGCWCSMTKAMASNFGTEKRDIFMISYDQAHRDVDSFRTHVEASICWQVVFLFRDTQGDHGWSGGWVHFAVDCMLYPTDSVVFEIIDNTEGDKLMAEARAAAAAGKTPSAGDAAAAGGDAMYVYRDAPNQRKYVRAYIFRSAAYETETEQQDGEQGAAAAAAGAKPAEGAAAAVGAAAADGAEAAAVGDGAAGRASRKRKAAGGAQPKQKDSKQQKQGASVAEAAAAAAAAGGARKKRGRQHDKQEQEEAQPSSSRKKAKTGASAAAAARAAGKPSKANKAASGGRGGKQASWVPQPANPKVLVPPPTDDEIACNDSTESDFIVEKIMGHKVSKGQDLFLIRWEGFGPYWDSWEGRNCLNAAPHTYAWQGGKAAIPAKFKA